MDYSLTVLPHGSSSDAESSRIPSTKRQQRSPAGARKPLTPQAYADTVSAHAHNHTIETSIYPGPHFERLASYLQRPFEDRGRRIPASALAAPTTKPFVFIYHYVHLSHDNATPAELTFPQDVLRQPDANAECDAKGGLVFMRGLPSSEWLVNLGATYRVDPEFFQRHLDFFSTTGRINHYPPVSMPSSSSYMVELRYMTIAKQGIFEHGITPEQVQRLRADAKAETNTYLTGLSSSIDRDEGLGSSIVRGVWVFNSGHLVIEQAMSLCVNRSDGPWTAIAWIDTGKDLGESPVGPWSKSSLSIPGSLNQSAFLPTIQIRPWTALRSHHPGHEVSQEKRPPVRFAQSAALLHLGYGRTLDSELMGSDAFYAFHELFVFCASSHAQLLALIEDNISAEDVGSETSPETLGLAQSNYMYMQELLEGLVSRLQANVETIKVRGGPSWPRSETPAAANMAKMASETLRKDYQWLLHRAEVLSDRCKSKIGHLTTLAMLAESKKAMEQAEKVTQLTRLAFIFVPLSCTSSVFGMNLTPLVSAEYSLWLWGVVSFPIVGIALLLMRWDIRVLFGRVMRNVRRDQAEV